MVSDKVKTLFMMLLWSTQAFLSPLGPRSLVSTSPGVARPQPLYSAIADRPETELGDPASGLAHDKGLHPEDEAANQESGRRVYVRLPTPEFSGVTEQQWEDWVSLPEKEEAQEKEKRRLGAERAAGKDDEMPEWQKDVLKLEMPRKPQEASARDYYVGEMQVRIRGLTHRAWLVTSAD